jgi:histone H3/H4
MPKTKQTAQKRPQNYPGGIGVPHGVFVAKKSAQKFILPPDDSDDALSAISGLSRRLAPKTGLNSPPKIIKKKIAKKARKKVAKVRPFEISRAAFKRIVKEFTPDFQWRKDGMEALQLAFEDWTVGLFEDVNSVALHAKRVTVTTKDLHLVARLRKINWEPL